MKTLRLVPLALLAGLALAPSALAQPSVAELFVDKGDTFARAGSEQGLKVGSAVTVLGPTIGDTQERRRVGTATVLEVWDSLARVSLDADATKESGTKFVELPKGGAKAKAAAGASGSTASPAAPEEQPSGSGKSLKGRASATGPRITLYNDSNAAWTNCELRLPSNRRYILKQLGPHDSEGIMSLRFVQDGVPRDLPMDSVNVKCDQGERRFSLR